MKCKTTGYLIFYLFYIGKCFHINLFKKHLSGWHNLLRRGELKYIFGNNNKQKFASKSWMSTYNSRF